MSINFACRHCGKTIKCKESLSGKPANCPACGERITVPPLRVIPTAAHVGATVVSRPQGAPAPVFDEQLFEPENPVPDYLPTMAPRQAPPITVPRKFGALRLVAGVYRIAGIIAATITCVLLVLLIVALLVPDAYSRPVGLLTFVMIVCAGGGIALSFFATGELILLAISFEESARASRELLQRVSDSVGSR